MNTKKIIMELGIIKQKLTDKTADEVRNAYYNLDTGLWELYELGETFGGKIESYLTDEEMDHRFRDFKGLLVTHDRRGQEEAGRGGA